MADGPSQGAAPPMPPRPTEVPTAVVDGDAGFGSGPDRFLSVSMACVRSDARRCGKLDSKSVLRLCARYKINVPSDMAENARQKGEVAYVKFIDKVRERGA